MSKFTIHEMQAYFLLLFFFLMNCLFALVLAYEVNEDFAGPNMATTWLGVGTIALWVFAFGIATVVINRLEKTFFRVLARRQFRKFLRTVRDRMPVRRVRM